MPSPYRLCKQPVDGVEGACRALSGDALRFMAYHIHPRNIYPGHLLCRQGDEADSLWVLSDGASSLDLI